jgi:hypothetical protein
MVLQPVIEGMLGLTIHAQENKIILAPHLPADWDSLSVENIRMGEQSLNFKYNRIGNEYTYQFTPLIALNFNLEFSPSFPAGTVITRVLLNGQEASIATFKTAQYVTLLVNGEILTPVTIQVETDKGISVLPVIQDPKPGDKAEGLRIISTNLTGNKYSVVAEGVSGSSGILEFFTNGQEIENVENGTLTGSHGNIFKIAIMFDHGKEKYIQKTVIVTLK